MLTRAPNIVQEILKFDPDINNKSIKNAFKHAVLNKQTPYKRTVNALLEYGFMINLEEEDDLVEIFHGFVRNGCIKIVEEFLNNGIDVNVKEKCEPYSPPLHTAAKHNQSEIPKLLINFRADVNATNAYEWLPLDYAIDYGYA